MMASLSLLLWFRGTLPALIQCASSLCDVPMFVLKCKFLKLAQCIFQSLLHGLIWESVLCWTELCWRVGVVLVVTAEAVGTPPPIPDPCYGDSAR